MRDMIFQRAESYRETTGVRMSSEQPKLNDSEATDNSTSDEPKAASQKTEASSSTESSPTRSQTHSPAPAPAQAVTTMDPDEARPSGDVDFGQLLDQFEQEQATLQEGEVVRGTVVGISERGVVIDFGYKSEGIVNPAEFTE